HCRPKNSNDVCTDFRGWLHFVINKKMACVMLGQALRDEGKALKFYSQLCQANQSAKMHDLLDEFTEQRLIQCQVLQECHQRLRDVA
ncbi:hypothetical protein, partial [Halomonas sp. PR-M31]|uniref:hypothetical protein n=1 Tax=Halomonas sp. PR-M31 TaxID=1471202 RepID=UPI001C124BDF